MVASLSRARSVGKIRNPKALPALPFPIRYVIYGNPVSQKNSRRIHWVMSKDKGKPSIRVAMSNQAAQWRKSAVAQLLLQRRHATIPAGLELNAAIVSYLGKGQRADADNLLCAPLDALVLAEVIASDYWVRTFNGSDRHRDERVPRVEIVLSPYTGSW